MVYNLYKKKPLQTEGHECITKNLMSILVLKLLKYSLSFIHSVTFWQGQIIHYVFMVGTNSMFLLGYLTALTGTPNNLFAEIQRRKTLKV